MIVGFKNQGKHIWYDFIIFDLHFGCLFMIRFSRDLEKKFKNFFKKFSVE